MTPGYGAFGSSLRDLPRLRTGVRRRASSWDRSGGNRDYALLDAGDTLVLADIEGAGCIQHVWMTTEVQDGDAIDGAEPDHLRKLALRMVRGRTPR
jgi:hypothetical protein